MDTEYSITTRDKRSLQWDDYLWLASSLGLSCGIGIYNAIKDRKKESPAEFHVGGRKMHPFPVALSLIVTFLSPITLLGVPGEVYIHSTMFWWIGLAILAGVGAAGFIFHAFFYSIGVTSVFQYLEERFGRKMRVVVSLTWFLRNMLYQSIVLCGPALTINAVTGLEYWKSVLSIGCVVIFYTALGGMKTVIWTDSFQALLMLVGLLTVLIKGSIVVGGIHTAWDVAANASRIKLDDFSLDPTVRHSFWSVFVGGGFYWFAAYSINQAEVQRAVSCSSQAKAGIAMMLTGVGMLIFMTLCCLIGVVIFAFYSQCDPLRAGIINKSDQLFPLFTMDILHGSYGLPGVVLSCICAGSLSTISSILNSMSAVILEDYIQPYRRISSSMATLVSKLSVVVCGAVTVGLAFIASMAASQMHICYVICSLMDGPMFGAFFSGMFLKRVKQIDILLGFLVTFTLMLWLQVTNLLHGTEEPSQPTSTASCGWNFTNIMLHDTLTSPVTNVTEDIHDESTAPWKLYNLSYLYYSPVGALLTVLLAFLTSYVTAFWFTSDVSPSLLHPLLRKMSRDSSSSRKYAQETGNQAMMPEAECLKPLSHQKDA